MNSIKPQSVRLFIEWTNPLDQEQAVGAATPHTTIGLRTAPLRFCVHHRFHVPSIGSPWHTSSVPRGTARACFSSSAIHTWWQHKSGPRGTFNGLCVHHRFHVSAIGLRATARTIRVASALAESHARELTPGFSQSSALRESPPNT